MFPPSTAIQLVLVPLPNRHDKTDASIVEGANPSINPGACTFPTVLLHDTGATALNFGNVEQ